MQLKPFVINLRAGDCIPDHDSDFAPVETLEGVNLSRFVHSFNYNIPQFIRHELTTPCDLDPDGDVRFTFKWRPRIHPNPSQNIVLEVESVCIADDENWDQALVSKGKLISASKVTTGNETIETLVISIADLEWGPCGDVVTRYSRDANDVNDTLDDAANEDDDALLFGIRIEIDRR